MSPYIASRSFQYSVNTDLEGGKNGASYLGAVGGPLLVHINQERLEKCLGFFVYACACVDEEIFLKL